MSPRPKNIRKVRGIPLSVGFAPLDNPLCMEEIILYVEEYEAIYLCDYEGKTQAEAAESMGISRPTLTRIYASARKKIAEAIIGSCRLIIEGGTSYMDARWFRCSKCGFLFNNIIPSATLDHTVCPLCKEPCVEIEDKELKPIYYKEMKKIALPTRNGMIDDHFGHCEFYTILTVDDNNKIVMSETIPSPQGCGCKSNIAFKLQEDGVTVMLAGNMGEGALNKLSSCNIKVIRGCKGAVLEVAEAYLAGKIQDSGVGCAGHHEAGHVCSHH